MRVVSVLPSATEIVCAIGHRPDLVARSSECDYPEDVRTLPVVMHPRTLDADRSSKEIDERVRRARDRRESLYALDVEGLGRLAPEVLLTQDLCGVCSVTDEEVVEACKRAGIQPRIVSLSPTNLAQVWNSVETVGEAVGDLEAGRMLADSLRARTHPSRTMGRTVSVVEWLDPPIEAGLWTPDLVTVAGGEPIAARSGEPGRRTSWSELARSAPDLLILSPCSFSVERSRQELRSERLRRQILDVRPPLGTYVADEAYFSRPGPRLANGAELVHSLLEGRAPQGPMPVAELRSILPEVSA